MVEPARPSKEFIFQIKKTIIIKIKKQEKAESFLRTSSLLKLSMHTRSVSKHTQKIRTFVDTESRITGNSSAFTL